MREIFFFRASQVPATPLYTCHGLRTPPTLHKLAICACVVLTSTALQASSVGTRFRSDASTSGARTPYGLYNSLSTLHVGCSPACVLTPERVHQSTDSAQRARLDTGGWLNLTRRGLSPRKVLQASLVALTPGTGEFMEVIVLCQAFPAQNERRSKFRMVTIVIANEAAHFEPPLHL